MSLMKTSLENNNPIQGGYVYGTKRLYFIQNRGRIRLFTGLRKWQRDFYCAGTAAAGRRCGQQAPLRNVYLYLGGIETENCSNQRSHVVVTFLHKKTGKDSAKIYKNFNFFRHCPVDKAAWKVV